MKDKYRKYLESRFKSIVNDEFSKVYKFIKSDEHSIDGLFNRLIAFEIRMEDLISVYTYFIKDENK